MWLLSLVVLVPLAIVLLGSFKTQAEAVAFSLQLPKEWHFDNYKLVIHEAHILRAMANSLIITIASVAICVLFSSMGGFVLARKKGKFAEGLYLFFYLGMIIPVQTISTIKLLQMLHIYGEYIGVIIICVVFNISFAVFLYTGFFKSIPREIDEAAFMDGASTLQTFIYVIFPIAKSATVSVASLIFLGIWNDINIPLYYMSDSKMWTMPITIYNFFGKYYQSWNLVFANIVLIALPVFLIYVLSQRYLVAGLTVGAVKG
ncbi:MAG: carbohydrate ABC transporter permease [Oliverpabstia sp.]